MHEVIQLQEMKRFNLCRSALCSVDNELIDAPTKPLLHRDARFLCVKSGSGVIRIQNTDYPVGAGDVVAILPWQISEVARVDEPLQYSLVVYQIDTLNDLLKAFYEDGRESVRWMERFERYPVTHCAREQAERIDRILSSVSDEVGSDTLLTGDSHRPFSHIFVMNYLVEMVVLLVRAQESGQEDAGGKTQKMDKSRILRYIYTHCGEKLTLKDLSRLFYMSESSISAYITGVTGLSFFDLLNEMRIGKTANYLLYTDLTLEEIAEILGYVDASHISKVFSARIGMKIGEYRKTYQRIGEICRIGDNKKAYGIVSFVYKNYRRDITAQNTAARFAISVPELHRLMLYQVEKNFEDFLNFVRVNRACELLSETDMKIDEIAYEVGYHSYKTLSRNFLKLRVMTPSDYRKQVTLQKRRGEL